MTTRTNAHEPTPDLPPQTDELVVEDDRPTPLPLGELPLEADPADALDQLRSIDDVDTDLGRDDV